ncbi:BRCA2, helical [Musa troglodytarum]|uniref:BRCA2, helical n=1 Tax=Musa troglodytarum TaxID=320322 RepID=A0A9E7JXJ9_9LILI|nr:BRCA2, helical [Musa troglodytarum]
MPAIGSGQDRSSRILFDRPPIRARTRLGGPGRLAGEVGPVWTNRWAGRFGATVVSGPHLGRPPVGGPSGRPPVRAGLFGRDTVGPDRLGSTDHRIGPDPVGDLEIERLGRRPVGPGYSLGRNSDRFHPVSAETGRPFSLKPVCRFGSAVPPAIRPAGRSAGSARRRPDSASPGGDSARPVLPLPARGRPVPVSRDRSAGSAEAFRPVSAPPETGSAGFRMPETGSAGFRMPETGSAGFRLAGDRFCRFPARRRPVLPVSGLPEIGDRFTRFPPCRRPAQPASDLPETGSKAGGCRKPIPPFPAAGNWFGCNRLPPAQPAEPVYGKPIPPFAGSTGYRFNLLSVQPGIGSERAIATPIIASLPVGSLDPKFLPFYLLLLDLRPFVVMYLLLQILARPKLPEGRDGSRGDGERFPMFRTGTWRAVSVSESSIRKARSVLGGAGDTDTSGIETTSGGQDDRFPLFRTGSGKSVTIKESSLRKAAAVLEGNGINKGDKITLDVGAKDEVFPMFSTGSGKLVTEKESSIRKAAAIFIGENMEKESPNLLQCGRNNHDGYEKSILGNPSSTEKALSIIDGSNPKTEQLHKNFRWDMNREIAGTSLLDCVDVNSVQRSPENCINKFCSTGSHVTNGQLQKTLEHKLDSSDYGQSPVKFQTAGGRFITPLKGSTSLLATGKMNGPRSSKPSTTESSCCGRISTRYPFQLKRKNLKDFFGGPPTCQDLMVKCCITQSGSLPHEVSNMDADNAVTYRFYDASHHDEIGLEAFQVMLLKSGASSSNATKEEYAVNMFGHQIVFAYIFMDLTSSLKSLH